MMLLVLAPPMIALDSALSSLSGLPLVALAHWLGRSRQ
jgi:hypothetical protein